MKIAILIGLALCPKLDLIVLVSNKLGWNTYYISVKSWGAFGILDGIFHIFGKSKKFGN